MSNVQVVSRDLIKPSSPTPNNLHHLQLSAIDQVINPPMTIPFILFFSGNGIALKSSQLKKSLSQVLTLFYPLAGRMKKHEDDDVDAPYHYVECNDDGVEFYEARVDTSLTKFMYRPITEEPSPLLPRVSSTDVPLAVQANVFECGGFAIGLLLSHTIADGSSLFMFIKSWADVTRGDAQKVVPPTFGFASHFPPHRSLKKQQELPVPSTPRDVQRMNVVVKRFVFDATKIALLREKVYACSNLRPTRVEAVSTLIWRCMMRSRGEPGRERMSVALHSVNIRERMEPSMPENSFGNLVAWAYATCSHVVDDELGAGYLEGQLRKGINKIKGDHIKHVLQSDAEIWKSFKEGGCDIDLYLFSSWVRFPIYESDFGWGKPEWFSLGHANLTNMVILTSTRNEGGIVAFVFLGEGYMAKFEEDQDLLPFVSTTDI